MGPKRQLQCARAPHWPSGLTARRRNVSDRRNSGSCHSLDTPSRAIGALGVHPPHRVEPCNARL
eukprot:7936308-Pyramimonas_sp.AAC.1